MIVLFYVVLFVWIKLILCLFWDCCFDLFRAIVLLVYGDRFVCEQVIVYFVLWSSFYLF